jgi:hypothetical protein
MEELVKWNRERPGWLMKPANTTLPPLPNIEQIGAPKSKQS